MARRLAPGFRIGQSSQTRFDDQAEHLVTLGKRITLWSVAQRARIAKGPPLQNASSIDFAPGGRDVVAKNTRGDLLFMEVPTLDEKAHFSGHGFGDGTDIRFAPHGRHLIDGSWSGQLTVRDAATGDVV